LSIILGIDPGSRFTGIGVIESDGHKSRHLYHTCLKLGNGAMPERLGNIYKGIIEVIEVYSPTLMSIESVFVSKNAATALKLGQARGVAICAGVMSHLEIHEYAPREVKQAVVGTGAAQKSQVEHMTKILLNLQGQLQEDAADALGIALCHAHTSAFQKKINYQLHYQNKKGRK
jgi:crossover junction endodeoxyribonuclease RuvC